MKRVSAPFLLLAPLLGYLAAWFVWGLALPWLLALMLGGAALWTFVPRKGQGGWTFSRSFLTVALLGLSLWIVGAAVVGVRLVASARIPLASGWPGLAPWLLAGAAVVAAALAMVVQMAGRARREKGQFVLAPWLWLAGALAFALFPAVQVDCRGLDTDRFLAPASGFAGAAGTTSWGNHPERIPNRAQLPANLAGLGVGAGVVRCTQDARGHSRVFSFRASRPLILVQLSESAGQRRAFSALFAPGSHRQLSAWKAGERVTLRPATPSSAFRWRLEPTVEKWLRGLPKS